MRLYEFEQLDADQKIITLLSADVLSVISSEETIIQLYALGSLYVKMQFDVRLCEITAVNTITQLDELLPFVNHIRPDRLISRLSDEV